MEINVSARLWENRCKSCDRWYSADDIIYRWPQPQTEVTDIVLVVTWSVYFMYFFYFSFSLHMCVHMCIYKYVLFFFICSIILKYCKYTFWIKYLSIYLSEQKIIFWTNPSITYKLWNKNTILLLKYGQLTIGKSRSSRLSYKFNFNLKCL